MREIRLEAASLSEIRDAILELRTREDVAVFRGGSARLSRDRWLQILKSECSLGHDRRHYDFSGKLESADWWEISYQPDKATSYAYSNTRQPLHTDNAWFADPAELNFFLMEKQASSGGEQTIYRLSRLIEDLSSEEPALFRDLCATTVTIKKGDGEYFNRTSIIVLDGGPRIYWNFYRTEKPASEIRSMCDAFFRYLEGKESTPSVERLRCESGDGFCFNDLKMLHGRAAFAATRPYARILLQSMWRLPKAGP